MDAKRPVPDGDVLGEYPTALPPEIHDLAKRVARVCDDGTVRHLDIRLSRQEQLILLGLEGEDRSYALTLMLQKRQSFKAARRKVEDTIRDNKHRAKNKRKRTKQARKKNR